MKDMALFLAICELAIIVIMTVIITVREHEHGIVKGKLLLREEQEAKGKNENP